MTLKIGVVMDPLSSIHPEKDTTFALMLEAVARDFELFYLAPTDLFLQDGIVWGRMQAVTVFEGAFEWFQGYETIVEPLTELDVLLMRKDPPFDMRYIYTTYLLERAESQGVWVINKPASLRDANEKLFTTWFPQCCPSTLVTAQAELLQEFVMAEREVVFKPLGGMGGQSIFRVRAGDVNLPVILETMTQGGAELVMAQRFIPEIKAGDKRIILIDGEPIGYALARIPKAGDFRGNLVRGASGEGRELTERDLWICEQVGPILQEKGLLFVGLDVIGDYLTEINVTSPTGVRELDRWFGLNISADFWDVVQHKLTDSRSRDARAGSVS